ncbi:MAG TPA: ABC transporter permease, partial [Acidimicrobiales bacterium]|nr:ABC transporter permease [Acidimicrobiales bacterium]
AARGPKPVRVVSARVSIWLRLREIWRARELFAYLVRKEIKVKYMNSVLGFLWSMLNPALTLAVFYVLFTYFLPNGIPHFVIYMFSAMLVWNFFQAGLMGGTSSIVANGGIVKKVAFPREILVLASVGAAFMFFFYQSIVLVIFMFAFRHAPLWHELWLVLPALAAICVFAAALGVFLSAVNVYLRDTQHLVEVLLVAWFWAIPTVYAFSGRVQASLQRHTIAFIPHTKLIWLYFANPVTPIVMTFQRVFYNDFHPRSTKPGQVLIHGQPVVAPHPLIAHGVLANYPIHWFVESDLIVLGVSVLLFLGGLVVFGHLEGNFAEEL